MADLFGDEDEEMLPEEEEEDILDMGDDIGQKQQDALLMRFCPNDASMLYPQEDKRNKVLQYACRLCTYKEGAENQPLIYRNERKKEVGNILHTVPSAISDDPTLARSQTANCTNCGHKEAVFFQSDIAQSDSLALIFVCCNCDHKWMKRRAEEEHQAQDEEPEMDIDEEKDISSDDDDNDENEEDVPPATRTTEPFMDTFYGLASTHAKERAVAAQTMLQHCLIGPDANSKDAAYALQRLMNGLCSGRSAARQGNASALASFLKIAVNDDKIRNIRNEKEKDVDSSVSDFAFIRKKLLATTEVVALQGQARKRGSEERDYKFGRLFGILSIVRSGVILTFLSNDRDDVLEVTRGLVEDLHVLYQYKKWMREPAAHALGTLLKSFFECQGSNEDAKYVLDELIENDVCPRFLAQGDSESGASNGPYAAYSAEQIAILANIQAHTVGLTEGLPEMIAKPIFSMETVPLLAEALSETSSVTLPRTHLVWDSLWIYLTETDANVEAKNVDGRKLKPNIGAESGGEILRDIVDKVILARLLGMEKSAGNATHERLSLALTLVRNMLGVEFLSSISGRTVLHVGHELLESTVLAPVIVQRLFLNTIGTYDGKKNQGQHLLKPFASQVVEAIPAALNSLEENESSLAKLAVAKALLSVEPKFDTRTKTKTVSSCLGLDTSSETDEKLLRGYLDFLETSTLKVHVDEIEQGNNFVDLIFSFAKDMLRTRGKDTLESTRESFAIEVLHFFMVGAYLRCDTVEIRKSKKKSVDPVALVASRISAILEGSEVSSEVRFTMSARFISLLADIVLVKLHAATNKETSLLNMFKGLVDGLSGSVACGAATYKRSGDGDSSSESIIREILSFANEQLDPTCERLTSNIASLACALHMIFLSATVVRDENDEDDEDDECSATEDILEHISEIHGILKELVKSRAKTLDVLLLIELLAQLLSSPPEPKGPTGACTKLLKEIVKQTWVSTLTWMSSKQDAVFGEEIIGVILASVGVEEGSDEMDVEENEVDVDAEDKDQEMQESDVFGEATGVLDSSDEDASSSSSSRSAENSDTKDVAVDTDKLHSMLEADDIDDEDEDVLEHHAGADGALAKLIQMRKDARKAGQLAIRRQQLAGQRRCIMFLDVLLSGRQETWASLLHADNILGMLLPLLDQRVKIQRAVNNSTSKAHSTIIGEQQSYLDILTTLIKGRLLKIKVVFADDTDMQAVASSLGDLASTLLSHIRQRVSKDDRQLLSGALNLVLRCAPDAPSKDAVLSVYEEAIDEWTTKKATRIETYLFEDLLQRNGKEAKAFLGQRLSRSVENAHSSFVQTEATRLIGQLFAMANDDDNVLVDCVSDVLAAINRTMKNTEMKKAKRAREILKALDKIFSFASDSKRIYSLQNVSLSEICDSLTEITIETESHGLTSSAEKLLKKGNELMSSLSNIGTPQTTQNASKKKKKKKGKK